MMPYLIAAAAAGACGVAGLVVLARWQPWLAALLALLLLAVPVWVFWIEPRSLVVTRLRLEVDGLAAPVRAAVIGDPQATRPHWHPARLRAAFARAAAERPDIVLWLGDYAYDGGLNRRLFLRDFIFVEPAEVIAAMATLDAPMGAYAVLGNHDWWWNGPEVARLLAGTHIRLLIDEAVKAEHPETGAALWVAGLDDISTPRRTDLGGVLAATDDSAPVIVLSHSPDIFPLVPEGPALTLSGHTHGGQVLVPFMGRPVVPIVHKHYAYGLYEEQGRRLFVTAGIGTAILPIRFLTPPEVVILDLVPAGD